MKALTIWQPWASLVAIGAKRIETRNWGTAYIGPLAIHAGKSFSEEARDFYGEMMDRYQALSAEPLPFGAVVATCRLATCFEIGGGTSTRLADGETVTLQLARSGELVITPEEFRLGNYEAGRFAWVFADVRALPAPVPCRGERGLWDWEEAA